MQLSFYAPSARFIVESKSLSGGCGGSSDTKGFSIPETTTPDVAIWMTDATNSEEGRASSLKLASLLSSGELEPRGTLLIVVNKM